MIGILQVLPFGKAWPGTGPGPRFAVGTVLDAAEGNGIRTRIEGRKGGNEKTKANRRRKRTEK